MGEIVQFRPKLKEYVKCCDLGCTKEGSKQLELADYDLVGGKMVRGVMRITKFFCEEHFPK